MFFIWLRIVFIMYFVKIVYVNGGNNNNVCNNVDVFINFFNYLFELKLFLNFFFFNYVVYVIKSLCNVFFLIGSD